MARKSTRRTAQAKSFEEGIATVVDPYRPDVKAFEEYYSKNRPCTNYKETLEYLNHLKFGVAHGMVNSKAANTQVYIISHILMILNKMERGTEELSEIEELLEQRGGQVEFTEEQASLITQQSSMVVQVQLIKKFLLENGAKIAVQEPKEKIVDAEQVYELTQVKAEEEGFI